MILIEALAIFDKPGQMDFSELGMDIEREQETSPFTFEYSRLSHFYSAKNPMHTIISLGNNMYEICTPMGNFAQVLKELGVGFESKLIKTEEVTL